MTPYRRMLFFRCSLLFFPLLLSMLPGLSLVGSVGAEFGDISYFLTSPLTVTDVSPDTAFGTAPAMVDTGGRVNGIIIDPTNDSILYAATEVAGIWKSIDGARTWKQFSRGLRHGITANNVSLAIDAQNPKRLLYATRDDDGRYGKPYGGLWVSDNAAGFWKHVTLCTGPDGISSVVFASGRPFVATLCGVWTTADANLGSATWTTLPAPPFSTVGAILAASKETDNTLFGCFNGDSKVYRSVDLGLNWGSGIDLGGACFRLSVAPLANETRPSTVVAIHGIPGSGQEVTVVNFELTGLTRLDFSSHVVSGGSGQSNVYTPLIASSFSSEKAPGLRYDVYAADGCVWFAYVPAFPPIIPEQYWRRLQGPLPSAGRSCNGGSSGIHVDTWGMAFGRNYDPWYGVCSAYASTDGGVFASAGSTASFGGCVDGWVTAHSGLHTLYSNMIAGLSRPSGMCPTSVQPCPLLYLPTGDNDVYVSSSGGSSWENFTLLGDAGQAWIDPLLPNQVLVSRNLTYDVVSSPPLLGGSVKNLTPPCSWPGNSPGNTGLSQVFTLPGETAPTNGDYVAIQRGGTYPCPSYDVIVRNVTDATIGWHNITPVEFFGAGQAAEIQTSGGHSGLNVYVLTGPRPSTPYSGPRRAGQIWRGQVGSKGTIDAWVAASGSGLNALVNVVYFVANPYDPAELYAVDVGDGTIKVSRDAGQNWFADKALTDMSSNYGEFRIDCQGDPGVGGRGLPFADGCSLSGMAFNKDHPNIRVAALFFGGLAFSRDSGRHWMPLDVTSNFWLIAQDLPELPVSVFYDPEPNPVTGYPSIYAGLHGRGIKRIDGPFTKLGAVTLEVCPACAGIPYEQIGGMSARIGPGNSSLPLRPDPDGRYRLTVLLDISDISQVDYVLDMERFPPVAGSFAVPQQAQSTGIVVSGYPAGAACAASFFFNSASQKYELRIPALSFNGLLLSVDFAYVPNTLNFALTRVTPVEDRGAYDNCAPAALARDLSLHVPVLIAAGNSYFIDLGYAGDLLFTLSGIGQN